MHSVPVPIIVRSGRAWRTLKTTLMTQLYRWRRDFGAAQQADIHLFDTEFFGVPVEHKALTCKETDFQPGTHPIVVLSRDAVNESIAFQYCRPYGREIISLAHQLGTQLRQVVCSLFCHQTMPVQRFTLSIDLNQSVGRNENGLRRNRRRVDSEARGRMHGAALLPLPKTATLDSEAIGALAPAFDTATREVFAGRIIALVRSSESAQQRFTNRKTNVGGLANRG